MAYYVVSFLCAFVSQSNQAKLLHFFFILYKKGRRRAGRIEEAEGGGAVLRASDGDRRGAGRESDAGGGAAAVQSAVFGRGPGTWLAGGHAAAEPGRGRIAGTCSTCTCSVYKC